MGHSRLIRRFAAAVLACACAAGLAAQSVPAASLKPTGFVDDFAHVLDPQTAAALEQRARDLDQQIHVQVALVTVASTGGADAGEYSYDLAEHWGVGRKTANANGDKDTGILILIAVHDHHYFTQIGYGLEPYITDADAGSWMRDLLPQLRAADYGGVFSAMLDNIEQTLAQRMPGASAALGPQASPTAPPPRRSNPLPGLILFGLFWFIMLGLFRRRGGGGGPMGCLLPFLMSGGGGFGGGGFSGGGFGGGGGGFGGFGGGGFGGGGAGGSW